MNQCLTINNCDLRTNSIFFRKCLLIKLIINVDGHAQRNCEGRDRKKHSKFN